MTLIYDSFFSGKYGLRIFYKDIYYLLKYDGLKWITLLSGDAETIKNKYNELIGELK